MAGKELKEGFTTGACSAAAAKAATRLLLKGKPVLEIETTLPNKRKVFFTVKRCQLEGEIATCSVVKDAGDDPDCTHGAELTARVRLTKEDKIKLKGGDGVAVVTKAGLGLEIGQSAINPVPRKNISEMILEELQGSSFNGAEVEISVPGGQEMAKKTMNERLGLIGGISILGTTGIVKPYSTAAFKASVIQAIQMAKEYGINTIVLTTGGKSEKFAMDLLPNLNELSFIQVGDFIGTGIKTSVKESIRHTIIVGMIGKLSKMADGVMMTHRGGSSVNTKMLSMIARSVGVPKEIAVKIQNANTARHVLEVCKASGYEIIATKICEIVAEKCSIHAGTNIMISCYMVDFDGKLLGKCENFSQNVGLNL
ncbi:cobalt-precorrin-5B (C(1))-methyltransferase [Leptospira noguchii]|uniref:Cobalt-precorrin-5B C(1)-methyltransferase n=1 Tax=Leptospira noguchii TaxID=28182 RepID=A0A9Q8RNZ5_9LEPT|nr:cobalt-precorrin-5B (C(1))-methyltransferase [Leptospira noguchii]EMS88771.1 cobalamin biosynthesis protein CbiD [Leptospira noguchii str. Hook]TQE80935.1 cobalt-precorrin-5B (C(1))-methyltransferase [Leptospira noguchii]UOG32535.1 cobalt-precorrin-5B (C(1))-methyltransferase [Leptospira noguchii]UOG54573.1 cobalt-precorrin-5B (C(1))-methyltransferase [Leptospira noguchii]UOG58697.1 cobalt-precorrin-5B (C(1))-methyltransferase [Leptospira noguchii]